MLRTSIITVLAASITLGATTLTSSAAEGPANVRDHRTKTEVRDHRTQRPNEVVVVGQGRYDCRSGAFQLYKLGYTAIDAYDCDGAVYHYSALDGAALFRAAMSSHSGEMTVTFIGLAE